MNEHPKFSKAELELVIELLECEHHELPDEIHHCRVSSYREELKRQHEMVKKLLERLKTT